MTQQDQPTRRARITPVLLALTTAVTLLMPTLTLAEPRATSSIPRSSLSREERDAVKETRAAERATRRAARKAARQNLDGAAIYRATCNRCHVARTIEELRPATWQLVITHMQVRGSLPQRDIDALLLWMNPPGEGDKATREADAKRLFPDLPILSETCTSCHGPSRIADAVTAGQDASWWASTLRRMKGYGARLNVKKAVELGEKLSARAAKE